MEYARMAPLEHAPLRTRTCLQGQAHLGGNMKHIILVFLAALWAPLAGAQGVIIDAAGVADALSRNVLVWDVRAPDAYAKGHIPGAVSIGDAPAVLRDANTEDFIAAAQIEKLLGAAGIDPAREVVIYGSRGGWQPYFGLYTLQYFGGKNVRVYHEGIEDWTGAGKAVAQGASVGKAVALKLVHDNAGKVSISTRDMIALLGKSQVQILDVRTAKEFSGEDIRAIRGGHIPGAVNIPYEDNWVDPETATKLARKQVSSNAGMSLKPVSALKALYAKLDPEKETIVYCQSGARASETAGVLQQLGFKNVKVYDSSWLGYGNTLDAPAENATFFNVGLLNSRLSAMQNRIELLEKELAAARGGK
jgi:thiosulfate/3-mercaptopyruvate sulfurtransferase